MALYQTLDPFTSFDIFQPLIDALRRAQSMHKVANPLSYTVDMPRLPSPNYILDIAVGLALAKWLHNNQVFLYVEFLKFNLVHFLWFGCVLVDHDRVLVAEQNCPSCLDYLADGMASWSQT